jgi:tungstate transport system substrate-binding protein
MRSWRGAITLAPVLAAITAALLLLACGGKDQPTIRLATTTSARDSGLLDWLLPEIERSTGVVVQVIAVGTGQAIEIGKRGDADFVIVHDRPREDAFVTAGYGLDRRDLMWNDFVIVGPPADPAGVRGEKDAVAALKKIAAAQAPFVSRGDDSGTHGREKSLWQKAGGKPAWPGYADAGQAMGATLVMASEKSAYCLTDRGTYAAMRKRLDLVVLGEGDPALLNPYGLILVDPAKNPGVKAAHARRVVEYLMSPEGQARIGAFRVDGDTIFHPGVPPK